MEEYRFDAFKMGKMEIGYLEKYMFRRKQIYLSTFNSSTKRKYSPNRNLNEQLIKTCRTFDE